MLTFPEIQQPVYPLKNKWENPALASRNLEERLCRCVFVNG